MMAVFNRSKAILVRLILLCHTLLTVWRVAFVYGDIYYLLVTATIPFLLEGIYTVIKRKGIEWKWICPCFVFYLLATLPNIWLLEINRTATFGKINLTIAEEINIIGVNIPLALQADTWVLVIEESLLYAMIIGRWVLPRGTVSRGQLSELLFTFIGIASDIMELFTLFDEQPVRESMIFTYFLLGLWSWSLFQFTMVLTVSSRPIRINLIEQETKMICIQPNKKGASLDLLATCVSLFMQDGPFLALRLYTMIKFNILNYSLLFFTTKNVLVILLLLYRLVAKCAEECCPETDEHSSKKMNNKYKSDLTKEDIIAALMSDVNTVRKRRNKQNEGHDDSLTNGRNTIDLNSQITMESIAPSEIPNTYSNVEDITDEVVQETQERDINDSNSLSEDKLTSDTNEGDIQISTTPDGIERFPQTPSPIKQLENICDESFDKTNTQM